MPRPPVDVDAFKNWKPDAQKLALELLRKQAEHPWKPFYCPRTACDGLPHDDWDWKHARTSQRPPSFKELWLAWVLKGGRGGGKTRAASELTHRVTEKTPRIALVAATGPDLRATMVEGVSGLLATAPPGKMPLWEPSKKQLTFPNGCIAQGFSAEEPDRLRGPEHGWAWLDEPAHFDYIDLVWDNLLFGLRLDLARCVISSTPKPTKWLKALLADPLTREVTFSTYENIDNLAETFQRTILAKYEGTRLGRQELYGEVLEDVEGALWQWEMIHWIAEAPDLTRIIVGVDPAGSQNKKSDQTAIVVVGVDRDKKLYVLHAEAGIWSPGEWARRANGLYERFSADAIAVERNYGGDMVRFTLENSGYKDARLIEVKSRRGKEIRAEPIVALYEKTRVYHVGERGDLSLLEDEITSWVPGEGDSPNLLDALVHACTELMGIADPVAVATPSQIRQQAPTNRHLRAV